MGKPPELLLKEKRLEEACKKTPYRKSFKKMK